MTIDQELLAVLQNPDTIDIVLRKSDYVIDKLKEFPQIKYTQILSGRYIVAYINNADIRNIIDITGVAAINAFPLVLGLLDKEALQAAGILQVQQQPFLDLKGNGVLVGIVDTGIDYTNPSFIYEDGTSKIKYLYDQSILGNPPEGFYTGTEYTQEQINTALKSSDPYSIVPSKDTVGHGTFLASVAAGREVEDNIGAAPNADLLVVKLRTARPLVRETFLVPPEQENAYSSTALMVGLEYLLRKAEQMNRPISICIGLGTNSGGHDGFNILEEYISQNASLTGVCICTAAGNESQAKHHTQGILKQSGEEQQINIKAGDDAGNIFINIYNGASDRISVSVRSPAGELVGRIPAKSETITRSKLILEKSTVIISYYFPVEQGGSQLTNIQILNATPGVWTINVYGEIVLDGTYHAWLPLTGFVAESVEFLTPVPNYTVVVPSTAIGSITCGAYDSNTNSLYVKTSWGPTRLPMMSPDFVAPGVDVGGSYPTGPGVMSGTSVSTAIATGACALLLQWGIIEDNQPAMSTYQARAYIIRGCDRDPKLTYPNTQWGYGRLNLLQTFNLMRASF